MAQLQNDPRMTAGTALETIDQAYIVPQLPLFFDLSSDPHEDFNLWTTTLTIAWLFDPMLTAVGKYEESVKKYPNIYAGAKDSKGNHE